MTALEIEGTDQAESLRLRTAADGRLIAYTPRGPVPVRVRQCFPWSEPHRHLSLRDAEEREVALVEDPESLGDESRVALERALAEAGFVLDVSRVVSIEEEVEIRQWEVETRRISMIGRDRCPAAVCSSVMSGAICIG
jgi:uncharacterized protein DUF1854